ncbi:MAG: hypothetical protein ACD_62C00092G0003 [uncultured bacterium]|nr:MAG: hypothetical protein ACD_62C00092G0003 [uncultured bacterium]
MALIFVDLILLTLVFGLWSLVCVLIKIAHSPDSDDAFMFWALKHGLVASAQYQFQIERHDIEQLNQLAKDEVYDITALSLHAYAHVTDRYVLTSSGASFAEKDYGPLVVAKKNISPDQLFKHVVAVPGELTTALLLLKIFEPRLTYLVMPFDQIIPAVLGGRVDAGLIIHEGQLQYQKMGLTRILSLIDVWHGLAGDLPLPLGGSAIKRSLGEKIISDLSNLQKQSIQFALNHPEEARDYARGFKRDMTTDEADQYLRWYANERTLEMGEEGQRAIQLLYELARERGLLMAQSSKRNEY